MNPSDTRTSRPSTAALTLLALGVVFGDIGTSPLYALKEVFHGGHVATSDDNILGVLSLIFWTMTIIVSVKYVLLILRADNNGEGGLIAMLAIAGVLRAVGLRHAMPILFIGNVGEEGEGPGAADLHGGGGARHARAVGGAGARERRDGIIARGDHQQRPGLGGGPGVGPRIAGLRRPRVGGQEEEHQRCTHASTLLQRAASGSGALRGRVHR